MENECLNFFPEDFDESSCKETDIDIDNIGIELGEPLEFNFE